MRFLKDNKSQLMLLGSLIAVYALLALATYLFFPVENMIPGQSMPAQLQNIPRWVLGAANGLVVLVLYGLLGLAGLWFSIQLGLPKVFRSGDGWKKWFWSPMLWGAAIGIVFVAADRLFAIIGGGKGFPHPPFPFSAVASASAGIGEEIMFRFFVMGLWAYLLNFWLKKRGATKTALLLGNIIAALAFSATHIPGAMMILGIKNFADIPANIMAELIILNGLLGLIAGDRYIRYGLVAAIGVHFWTDIVWHVLWPLLQ
jgi:hypothetical protein